jgi:hypothetical protein
MHKQPTPLISKHNHLLLSLLKVKMKRATALPAALLTNLVPTVQASTQSPNKMILLQNNSPSADMSNFNLYRPTLSPPPLTTLNCAIDTDLDCQASRCSPFKSQCSPYTRWKRGEGTIQQGTCNVRFLATAWESEETINLGIVCEQATSGTIVEILLPSFDNS